MKTRLLVTTVAAMLVALSASAQDAPQFVRVFEAQLQPNTQQTYEAVLRRFAEAHKKLDTKRYYFVSTNEIGSPTTYTFGRVFSSMSAMNEPPRNVIVEAFGEEEAAQIVASLDGRVISQRSMLYTIRPDLSPAPPDDPTPPALINWLQVKIKPYGNAAYEAYLAKVAEATEKVAPQFPYTVFAPGAGADNTYGFANPIATWEALDEGAGPTVPQRLVEAFGERQAQALLEGRAAVVESQSVVWVRPRPDLSYQPDM